MRKRIEIVNFSQRFWLKVGDKAVAVSGHVRKVCEVTKICGTERVYVRTTAGEFNDNGRERRKGGNLRLEAYDEAREAEKAAEEANKQEASRAAMRLDDIRFLEWQRICSDPDRRARLMAILDEVKA